MPRSPLIARRIFVGAATLLAALAAALTAACSRGDSGTKVSFDAAQADVAASEPLGPGDVRVTSTDGALILALVGDSVRMQLSDSLRESVRASIDSSADSGFGGMITRSVSGIVGSAMGFVVRIPVRELENVRYEDGQIRLETKGGQVKMRSGNNNDDRSDRASKATFSAADGERFVAAVKARQAELDPR